ncbi:MAG: hypothetical protein ACREBC_29325 [Pyrinomonadaceae bacterium]
MNRSRDPGGAATQLVPKEVQRHLDEGRPALHELREVEEHREQVNAFTTQLLKRYG